MKKVDESGITTLTPDDVIQRCALPTFLKEDLVAYTILPKSPLATKTWSTLIHLYEALYDTIQSGRYNMYMSCKDSFEHVFKIDNEDDQYLRCQFLNSALMHYNSAFDIILECIWVGFGLYRYVKNEGIMSLNTRKETEHVLSLCTYTRIKSLEKVIDASLLEELVELRKKQQKISNWTNNLKHRGNLVYKESFEEAIHVKIESKENDIIFDSSKTQSQVSTDKVVTSLITYHSGLITFVRHLDEFYKNIITQTAINSSK